MMLAATTIPTVQAGVVRRWRDQIDQLTRIRDDLREDIAVRDRQIAAARKALKPFVTAERGIGFSNTAAMRAIAALAESPANTAPCPACETKDKQIAAAREALLDAPWATGDPPTWYSTALRILTIPPAEAETTETKGTERER